MTLIEELQQALEDCWNDGYATAVSSLDEEAGPYCEKALSALRATLSGHVEPRPEEGIPASTVVSHELYAWLKG